MKDKIEGACYSSIGRVRKNNEDNFYFSGIIMDEKNFGTENSIEDNFIKGDNKVFAIFDGMGGEAKGERASYLAAKELKKLREEEKIINWEEYSVLANDKICVEMQDGKRMGSTLAAIQFLDDYISIANLGDSRIYYLKDNRLKQISKDHTETISTDMAKKHKPRLTKHLGIRKDELIIHPSQKIVFYDDIEKIILCSDGITDRISDEEIERILKEENSPKKCCETLVKLANENGGTDNITVMVFNLYS